MGTPNNITGILEGAKKALANANKFTQSVEGNPTSSFVPHEFSKASYKLPHASRREMVPGVGMGPTGDTTAPEFNARLKMNAEAKKALEQ